MDIDFHCLLKTGLMHVSKLSPLMHIIENESADDLSLLTLHDQDVIGSIMEDQF